MLRLLGMVDAPYNIGFATCAEVRLKDEASVDNVAAENGRRTQ
jgi:hypothetical protein